MAEGAEGIELDVRLTADGVPVIAHDDALPAGSRDGRGPIDHEPPRISRLSASQLAAVRLPSGERIPTLVEALHFRTETLALVYVELKGDVPSRPTLVEAACAAFERYGDDRILVSSFDPRIVWAVSRRRPDVPVAWLVHSGQRILKHSPGWQSLGAVGVHPEGKQLSDARIQALLEQGALVNVWTVNDPERARELALAGVDGLITDAPRKILEALPSGP
jgi:glycerophosphoryl diester phosphodiesterase